jgi:hypothetical protein
MALNESGKCVDCGQPSVGLSLRCAGCQKEHLRESQRRYYRENHEKCLEASRKYKAQPDRQPLRYLDPWLGREYAIVRDPLPVDDGGFKPGAQFTKYELTYMARFGTLEDGALLRHCETGNYFVVDQGRLVRR